MKKTIIFLIILSLIIIPTPNTYAKTTSFYEGEYIPNIWLNRKSPYEDIIYYSQGRTFRETSSNNLAYCIEPFNDFYGNQSYTPTTTPTNFSDEKLKELSLIAHFGYGYKNHTDMKWYAITQLLIWQTSYPNGYYYISSYKNGPAVSTYQNEINEIKNLVNNYKKNTSFNNQTFYITENESLTITDTNNILNTYTTKDSFITINNNTLSTTPLLAGTYTINLEKNSTIHNKPILFYQAETSQKLIDIGDPQTINNKININVIKTSTTITKKDSETVEITQGEATHNGTTFEIYNEKDELIEKITLENNLTHEIKNLSFGNYYIKEIKSGTGYKLNENKYSFTISKDNPNNIIEITNDVIKGTLKIKKEYGYDKNFLPEKNISFNIFDSNDNLIKTIITNEQGEAEIILPYGKYKLIQLTTTEGYEKIEPLYFEIINEETLEYNLKNYKISVPNTKTESILNKILKFIKELLCLKK